MTPFILRRGTALFSLPSFCRIIATLVVCLAATPMLLAASDVPGNVDNGLRRLLQNHGQSRSITGAVANPANRRLAPIRDKQDRVAVEIYLDGKVPLAQLRDQLIAAGANIVAENAAYRQGVFSAFVPSAKISDIAHLPGVLSMSLTRRPHTNVGATTSGGALLLKTDLLNSQGLDGTGETIGVLSDSFDTAQTDLAGAPLTIHAAQDVATGDLPGPGNPNNPNPVFVVEEFSGAPEDSIDEGRAMLQIVHDVAPKAKLAFATGFISKVDFANNIRRLRTDAHCDVIVDDINYSEEPMFSDGIIAQAVNDVVSSSTLAGTKSVYFSSASNAEGGGYLSTFNPISDATARAGLPGENVKLDQVSPSLTSGGFHNFNPDPAGPPAISQTFIVTGGTTMQFTLQWNDPFDQPNGVTTDYNVLVFDAEGNFLSQVSGTSNNFMTQEALEDIMVENSGADARFQVVISRAGNTPASPVADKIRYLAMDDFGGLGAENFYQPKAPASYGHNTAVGAISTAAYVYDDQPSNPPAPPFTPALEDFSSAGGAVTIYQFNPDGSRSTEVRFKPDIAAPDGGNTTFFGDDYEGDGFPNFFGTSAAAPHAAAVAALLMQKAGGPASLSAAQVKNILQRSVTMQHDLDAFFSQAVARPVRVTRRTKRFSGGTVTVSGCGNSSNASAHDTSFFNITFDSTKRGETLSSVTIDINPAGLKFDTTSDTGFPFTLGKLVNISPADITVDVAPGDESVEAITLRFTPGAFTPGTSISFGIDRDFVGDGAGNQGDLLERAVVTASTNRNNLKGSFVNDYGFGFSFADGFGLINAIKAVSEVNPGTLTQK